MSSVPSFILLYLKRFMIFKVLTMAFPCSIPTIVSGDSAICSTDICQKEPSGNTQKLVFNNVDATKLDSLFVRGSKVDAFFSLEVYDYQQNAGIRLVAKRLVVHSN